MRSSRSPYVVLITVPLQGEEIEAENCSLTRLGSQVRTLIREQASAGRKICVVNRQLSPPFQGPHQLPHAGGHWEPHPSPKFPGLCRFQRDQRSP